MRSATLLILLLTVSATVAFRLQGVAVKGRLMCGSRPLDGAKVKIYDVDRNPGDPDDLLDEKITDENGEFTLDGTTRELTNIEPELRVYHDCNNENKSCKRKFVQKIPEEFIHHGTAENYYHFERNVFPKQDGEECKNE
ncbi:CRE-TTR-40 protein [Aphelenchoides avenae]|nr:CRE-TTR-40 protein [Aphelenchus avenae]